MSVMFTRRFIVVVKPAVASAVNTSCKNAAYDPVGGDRTFTVPLRNVGDPTNSIVGYWAAGAATPAMLTGLVQRLSAAGATAAETTLIPKGTKVAAVSGQRMFCFDADVWTPDDVLILLGVDRLALAAP